MHGKKLFELAKLVGLTQSAVARHLSISRVQVHFWAQAHRPIPVHYLEPLMEFLFQASKAFLKSGHPDLEPQRGSILGGGIPIKSPLRCQIDDLLYQCCVENMELRGAGPSASIRKLAAEIGTTYGSMSDAMLRKPENASHLRELIAELRVATDMQFRLGPLMDLVADDGVPEESTSIELSA